MNAKVADRTERSSVRDIKHVMLSITQQSFNKKLKSFFYQVVIKKHKTLINYTRYFWEKIRKNDRTIRGNL